jgi:hypothetical protein
MNQLEFNIKPTNSYPYVYDQDMLSFDSEGKSVINNSDDIDLLTDMSYQTVAKLSDSIRSNNFERFKQLYTEEYINTPDCCDFFKFEDRPPRWEYNRYSLCACENIINISEPYKIHKYMYVRPCNCSGGKRYLAYLTAYYSLEPGLYMDTGIMICKKSASITPIQQFLLDDGPIDLTYKQMYSTHKNI